MSPDSEPWGSPQQPGWNLTRLWRRGRSRAEKSLFLLENTCCAHVPCVKVSGRQNNGLCIFMCASLSQKHPFAEDEPGSLMLLSAASRGKAELWGTMFPLSRVEWRHQFAAEVHNYCSFVPYLRILHNIWSLLAAMRFLFHASDCETCMTLFSWLVNSKLSSLNNKSNWEMQQQTCVIWVHNKQPSGRRWRWILIHPSQGSSVCLSLGLSTTVENCSRCVCVCVPFLLVILNIQKDGNKSAFLLMWDSLDAPDKPEKLMLAWQLDLKLFKNKSVLSTILETSACWDIGWCCVDGSLPCWRELDECWPIRAEHSTIC